MGTDGKLRGRRILLTGAAGGIGRAVAALFAAEGAALALLDLAAEDVAELARPIGAHGFGCDVSSETQVQAAVSGAAAALGGLDGIVNAAGVTFSGGIGNLPLAQWKMMLDINLTGPFNIVRAALPALQAAPAATIVNISSICARVPMQGTSGYSASKAGLNMLTRCLALELAPNIRVNEIAPGMIRTEMTRFMWEHPEMLAQASQGIGLGRLGEPVEIAQAALYLTSTESSFVSGSALTVDGGLSWH